MLEVRDASIRIEEMRLARSSGITELCLVELLVALGTFFLASRMIQNSAQSNNSPGQEV